MEGLPLRLVFTGWKRHVGLQVMLWGWLTDLFGWTRHRLESLPLRGRTGKLFRKTIGSHGRLLNGGRP